MIQAEDVPVELATATAYLGAFGIEQQIICHTIVGSATGNIICIVDADGLDKQKLFSHVGYESGAQVAYLGCWLVAMQLNGIELVVVHGSDDVLGHFVYEYAYVERFVLFVVLVK